jgi:hypothetical protein
MASNTNKSADSPPPPSPPKSPPIRPTGSNRNPSRSSSSLRGSHLPVNPSGLRRSVVARESSSPEETTREGASGKRPNVPQVNEDGIRPTLDEHADVEEDQFTHLSEPAFWGGEPNVRSRLLGQDNWDAASGCGSENCGHGTFSPRPLSPTQGSFMTYGSFSSQISPDGFGGAYTDGEGPSFGESADAAHGILGDTIADGLLGGGTGNKMSTTNYLAQRHGIKNRRKMYKSPPSM